MRTPPQREKQKPAMMPCVRELWPLPTPVPCPGPPAPASSSQRRPAVQVRLLNLLLAQRPRQHHELVDAAGEITDGAGVRALAEVPVADLRVAQAEGEVELEGLLLDRLAVDVVGDLPGGPVVDD